MIMSKKKFCASLEFKLVLNASLLLHTHLNAAVPTKLPLIFPVPTYVSEVTA